jgi:heat shock protein HtpX
MVNKNNIKTVVLLAALGGVLIVAGQALAGGTGAFIGFGIGLLITGGSYWFSDKIAVAAARAKPVTRQEAPELYRIVEDLARRANMPVPRLYISPSPQPNAFATGRNEKHAVVAVTQGILPLLTEDELRGVLAHELAHVRNHDILLTSVAAAVALGITMLARMIMWGAMFGGMGNDRDGQNPLGLIAMMVLAPIAAAMLQMALSRSREFEADHDGAALLGSGESLARALEKIEAAAKRVPMNVDPAHATAYIVNPLTGRKINFSGLFSTHPPTAERVRRLRSGHGAGPFS